MCAQTCIERKRAACRKGSITTYQKHGRAHMQQIGRHGFWMLSMRLGDGHGNRKAALALLAKHGAIVAYR
jgi:hypothetical protein